MLALECCYQHMNHAGHYLFIQLYTDQVFRGRNPIQAQIKNIERAKTVTKRSVIILKYRPEKMKSAKRVV